MPNKLDLMGYELPYKPDYNKLHLEAILINLRLKTKRTLLEWIVLYKKLMKDVHGN
jgi:hypothetical protein